MQPSNAQPLAGLVVVEIGQNVAAPVAGQVFADLGAEVIKIEKGGGDDARRWGPPFWGDTSAVFKAINRNKRSVVVDFQCSADVDALRAFILARADVVIQSMRPGLIEDKGLRAAALLAEKPALIWCDLGAFGSGGPLSQQPGYDPLMQAAGGLMSVTGEPGRQPVRTGYSVVDAGTGMWAVIAIQAALHRRHLSGRGGAVEVSLYETALAWMTVPAAQYTASGRSPGQHGSGAEMIVPYRAFETQDGHLVVAAGNDKLFARLCAALGHSEWASDPRFIDNPQRVANRAGIDALIGAVMRERPSAHWENALSGVGVPTARVQSVAQALAHEQTVAIGMVQSVPGSDERLVAAPMRFDGARPAIRSGAPALGADNALLNPFRSELT
jgi:crotonobetainyl-CoA:carnitine CoA-transferase CaiB-like acyl-CoA transferase